MQTPRGSLASTRSAHQGPFTKLYSLSLPATSIPDRIFHSKVSLHLLFSPAFWLSRQQFRCKAINRGWQWGGLTCPTSCHRLIALHRKSSFTERLQVGVFQTGTTDIYPGSYFLVCNRSKPLLYVQSVTANIHLALRIYREKITVYRFHRTDVSN